MTGTPLAGLEQQMMAPPGFPPRGGGTMILNRFRYKPEDVDCKLCTEYRHRRCTSPQCPWLAERLEAGVVSYQALVAECFRDLRSRRLMTRIRKLIRGRDEDYVLYQTVKTIFGEKSRISTADLAEKELVDDATLRLIIDAALIARYGQAVLFIGGAK